MEDAERCTVLFLGLLLEGKLVDEQILNGNAIAENNFDFVVSTGHLCD